MSHGHKAAGTRPQWRGSMVMLAVLLVLGAVPVAARVRVFIEPGLVVPFGPFWGPYAYPYGYPYVYPPVVVAPPPQVYVPPAPPVAAPPPPPAYWYYCENPQGY